MTAWILVFTAFWVFPTGIKYETLYVDTPYETVDDCREAAVDEANQYKAEWPGGHFMFKCVQPPAPDKPRPSSYTPAEEPGIPS